MVRWIWGLLNAPKGEGAPSKLLLHCAIRLALSGRAGSPRSRPLSEVKRTWQSISPISVMLFTGHSNRCRQFPLVLMRDVTHPLGVGSVRIRGRFSGPLGTICHSLPPEVLRVPGALALGMRLGDLYAAMDQILIVVAIIVAVGVVAFLFVIEPSMRKD